MFIKDLKCRPFSSGEDPPDRTGRDKRDEAGCLALGARSMKLIKIQMPVTKIFF
jgi:hypothetical protein